jgi:hypothetical protein
MTTPWTYAGPQPSLSQADGVVTLVEGQTFCLSGPGGDVVPDLPHCYGFVDEALRVVTGLLDAADDGGGRLPELFAGLSRS